MVPGINLSYIPQSTGPAIPGNSGMSPFQPVVTQTQSGGDSGILGLLGPALSVAKLFAKTGGRIGYDQGGGASDRRHFPQVPSIDLTYITKATGGQQNTPHGSGPPHPPSAAAVDDPMKDASSLTSGMGSVGKMFGNDGSGSTSQGFASGGGIGHEHRQGGGGSVPVGVAAAFGGAPPNVSGQLQQLLQMPLNRLQEMAVQFSA